MPFNHHSDTRYEATREDVLRAVGPVPPNPYTGPDNPDPFGHNERPKTDFEIALRIAQFHNLDFPIGRVGRALKRNRLNVLLAQMVAEGVIVGRIRKEWAEIGRELPSRARDVLYASVEQVARWDQ